MAEKKAENFINQENASLPDVKEMHLALVKYFSDCLKRADRSGEGDESEEGERLKEVNQANSEGNVDKIKSLYIKYIGEKIGSKIDKYA